FIEDRERWLERYPRHRQRAAQPMDPVQYRGKRVVVLAPHPDDEIIGCGGTLAKLIAHRAHVTAVYATAGAQTASLMHASSEARVLSYGVGSLVPPNTYCDITDVVELQEQALLRYATAMKVKDYVHFCQDRNYYNACTLNGARGFYEVFFDLTARDYVSLVTTMERDAHPGPSGMNL